MTARTIDAALLRLPTKYRGAHRARRRITTVVALGLAGGTAAAATLLAAVPAEATPQPDHGTVSYAWQDSSTREIHIRGYAYDKQSKRSVNVKVYVDGRWVHTSAAKHDSPDYDREHHLAGKHGFKSVFRAPAGAHTVSLVAGDRTLTARHITHYRNAGAYIVAVARTKVGSSYRYGSDGPRSFDCSGFAKYVFARTDLANLPHNSESQRHARHMHRISKASARPGDLVFYLSGGDAYHVSIYAGRGRQYSASTPRTGVEYSRIWDHNVVYATNWH